MQTQMEQLNQIQANINKTHAKVLRHFINMEYVRAISNRKFQNGYLQGFCKWYNEHLTQSIENVTLWTNFKMESKPKTAIRKLQQEVKRIEKSREQRAKRADKEEIKKNQKSIKTNRIRTNSIKTNRAIR